AEDEHLAAGHPAVHPPGHLEDFVRSEVHPVEDVTPAVDHVAGARVVDHDRVEAPQVERGLAGGRHGEDPGMLHLALEKGPDDADGLPAVIERRGEALPLLPESAREMLDLRAGGHEDGDATLVPDHMAD